MAEITPKDEKKETATTAETVAAPGYERSISSVTPDGEEPTEEVVKTLRHIGDKIPLRAWLVAVVELSKRFTHYGLTGPFQNYMQNRRNDPLRPRALGLGQSKSTALSYFFTFWVYVMPIFGAVVADSWLGRYKAICVFTAIYMSGIFILFITSLPANLEHGAGLGGLITAMIVIGIGAGGIKSNVSPLIADQYTERIPKVKTIKKGERVIVDPNVTVQTIYNIFYWCINIGSLSAIATIWMELKIDFWAAYLLPFCFFWVAVAMLIIGRKQYVERPPEGTILPKAFKAMWIALKNKGNMDAAKPSYQMERTGSASVPWSDLFIKELKRGFIACRVFITYPVGQWRLMEYQTNVINNFNPISIIIFIPLVEKVLYPALRKWRIPFKLISRITFGFVLVSIAMAYAAGIQSLIRVHVLAQVPTYVITGFSEIFFYPPPFMKSVVMSMFLTNAFGSTLGIALSPAAKDPKLVGNYSGLAGGMFATAVIFYFCFRKYNATEEEMNKLDALDTKFAPRKTTDVPIGGRVADRVAEKEGVAEVSV